MKTWSSFHTICWAVQIMKFLSYNLISANREVLIIQFGEHENREVLVMQSGEQCKPLSSYHTIWWACKSWSSYHTIWWAWKSWSSHHTVWWTVQILKFLSFNLISSANHEVPHHTIWWACKSWSSYHTIWWAWKSWSSFHAVWWAVQIMKCLIIVCFSLLLFPLSLPKYLPQHPVLKVLPIFKYSSPHT